ncbi:hypothetical protein P1X15_25010 [Runella sp. MFBS21]|uniref:hypothetical protein n=1 Tax=Runella sp. MFBS21 TaxID=3034018 RepID=UPI0023FA01F4|nr:hypothetical protein [Runella sp. MFBS21]MDF7820907.1 hypothetical protein [Runella sp. MFBS21]
MKSLCFRTNIDCPFRLQKAACGLECLRGRYCQFSVDLMTKHHLLTIKSHELKPEEVVEVLKREGIWCEELKQP